MAKLHQELNIKQNYLLTKVNEKEKLAAELAIKQHIMNRQVMLLASLLFVFSKHGISQNTEEPFNGKRHFIGSTAFMVLTPLLDPSPKYYQLNYGYRITNKDVISIEAITWTYQGPLGRQYGPNYENPESDFPGSVRAVGAGLAYKRFLWNRFYAQIHSTAFHQTYLDESDQKIQSGFQLFNTLRFGYQIRLLKNQLFLEPSVAITSWPINTNLPASFQVQEDRFPKYFLFEPGLHFGVNF